MLNEALIKKIDSAATLLLYKNRVNLRKEKYDLFYSIRSVIRDIRQSHHVGVNDPLLHKLAQFGNEGGWARTKIAEFNQELSRNKTVPNDPMLDIGRWRSIEFELIWKNAEAQNKFMSWARAQKLAKQITVKGDGSLRVNDGDDNGIPAEVVVSYKKGDEHIIRNVCSFFKEHAYVNKSCGTHVHFDMRHQSDSKSVTMMAKRLARWVPALRLILPHSRRVNQYCAEDITSGRSRYAFVNLMAYDKYKTLEIRGHSGTIEAEKILNWIQICETIMARRVRIPKDAPLGVDRMIDTFFGEESVLGRYINARYQKFNNVALEEYSEAA